MDKLPVPGTVRYRPGTDCKPSTPACREITASASTKARIRWPFTRSLRLPVAFTLVFLLGCAPSDASRVEVDGGLESSEFGRGGLGAWWHFTGSGDDDTYDKEGDYGRDDTTFDDDFDVVENYAFDELEPDHYNADLVYQDHFGARFNPATDFNTTEEAEEHRAMLEAAELEELEMSMEREGIEESEREARRRLHKKDRGFEGSDTLYCNVGYGKLAKDRTLGQLDSYTETAEMAQWIRFCGYRGQGAVCFRAETKQWRDMKDIYPDVDWMKEKDFYTKYWIDGCGSNFHFQKQGLNSASCKNHNPEKNKGAGIWMAYNNDKTSIAERSFYDRNDYWFVCENDEYAKGDTQGKSDDFPRYAADSGVQLNKEGSRCKRKGKRYLKFHSSFCCKHEHYCTGPESCGKSCETR